MIEDEEQAELPSSLRPSVFLVGQDSRGNWVARDRGGTRGGLFVDRTQALRYIRSESGDRSQDYIPVIGVFELDIGKTPAAARNGNWPSQRKASVGSPDRYPRVRSSNARHGANRQARARSRRNASKSPKVLSRLL